MFHSSNHHDVRKSGRDLQKANMDRSHARATLLVYELRGDTVWKIPQEYRESPSVSPLFTHAQGRSNYEVIDLLCIDARPFDEFGQKFDKKFIGSELVKPVSRRIVRSRSRLSSSQVPGNYYVSHPQPSLLARMFTGG
jgi:hypothetical protein